MISAMFEEFLAQMLVLFMCILSGIRIFFIKNSRVDCFAVPAPLAFFTSLLTFGAFGLSLPTAAAAAISLLFALTNIRSCLRIFSKLIVDSYSPAFVAATLIEMTCALATAAALVYFAPVRMLPQSFGAKKTTLQLTGSAATQFRVVTERFQNRRVKTTGLLSLYEPAERTPETEKNPALLFAASPLGTVQDYEPYFLLLAQSGFTVLAADFCSPDMPTFGSEKDARHLRRFFARKAYFDSRKSNDGSFRPLEEKILENKVKGYAELLRLSRTLGGGRKVFLVIDQMPLESIAPILDLDEDGIIGFFPMNRITEYETTGLGFVNQTSPLFAHLLGFRRDRTLFMPRYLARKTVQDVLLYAGIPEAK